MFHSTAARATAWGGLALGFALGGFFDGIVLHQILQWHHLLSALSAGPWGDIRAQVAADGLFHLLMYAIAAIGLLLLWRGRAADGADGAGRRLLALALIGFGLWHGVDAMLSHWLLGIHRIRMDTPYPLRWDLSWLVAFGLVPFGIGIWLRRRRGGGGGGRRVSALLALGVLAAGPIAAMPPPGSPMAMVLFRDTTGPTALVAVDAQLVWSDQSGKVWLLRLAPDADTGALYRHGALWVSRTLLPAACLSWARG